MKDFRRLKVWQKAYGLSREIYRITQDFPSEEKFGLMIQIRRSSVSIIANIAEGCGRGSDADFSRFLQIAMGSACELECHLMLSHDLGYITDSIHDGLLEDVIAVKRMISSLLKKLKADR